MSGLTSFFSDPSLLYGDRSSAGRVKKVTGSGKNLLCRNVIGLANRVPFAQVSLKMIQMVGASHDRVDIGATVEGRYRCDRLGWVRPYIRSRVYRGLHNQPSVPLFRTRPHV